MKIKLLPSIHDIIMDSLMIRLCHISAIYYLALSHLNKIRLHAYIPEFNKYTYTININIEI